MSPQAPSRTLLLVLSYNSSLMTTSIPSPTSLRHQRRPGTVFFDRELLAVYLAIKHFRHFVERHMFYALTDHKPLTYARAQPLDRHTPRQICHLDYISQFTTDISFLQGTNNSAADSLSRIETMPSIATNPTKSTSQPSRKLKKWTQSLRNFDPHLASLS